MSNQQCLRFGHIKVVRQLRSCIKLNLDLANGSDIHRCSAAEAAVVVILVSVTVVPSAQRFALLPAPAATCHSVGLLMHFCHMHVCLSFMFHDTSIMFSFAFLFSCSIACRFEEGYCLSSSWLTSWDYRSFTGMMKSSNR